MASEEGVATGSAGWPVRRRPATGRRPSASGRADSTWLSAVAAAAVLPILIFAIVMIVLFDRREQAALETMLRQSARASINAVDRQLVGELDALRTLATTVGMHVATPGDFRDHAGAVLAEQDDWAALRLEDPVSRRVVMDLGEAPLVGRQVEEADGIGRVAATGQAQIGGLSRAAPDAPPTVLLRVPVIVDGRIAYTLSAAFEAATLSGVLIDQSIPEGWTAAVLDRSNIIVARNRGQAEFVGTEATASLTSALAGNIYDSFEFALTKEGERAYTAVSRSPLSGWIVAVGAPAALVEEPLRRSLLVVGGGGAAALLAAVVLAGTLIRNYGHRRQAERQLLSLEAVQATERRLADIAVNLPGAIYRQVLHPDGKTSFPFISGGAAALIGVPDARQERPLTFEDLRRRIRPEDRQQWRQALSASAASLTPFKVEGQVAIEGAAGHRWVRATAQPRREADGVIVWDGVLLDVTDIMEARAELEAALAEKDVLLQEVNHRVKNSLQLIASLLNVQAAAISDETLRRQFAEARSRVTTVAQVHERLYRTGNVKSVELGPYLRGLCDDLLRSLHGPGGVRLEVVAPADVSLPPERVIPLALIVNELVTNAFKYGYPEGGQGRVEVHLTMLEDGQMRLCVADDGRGLPPGFDPETSTGLGMRLVTALTRQLGGTLSAESSGSGARFVVVAPV
jgi:two-component sensor histidine kinase